MIKMIVKFGSQGPQVKQYKDMLLALGYLKASTHDFFGRDSQSATKVFQTDNGLFIDGIIGKNTSAVMYAQYSELNNPAPDNEEELAELISGKVMISYGAKLPIVKKCKDLLYTLGYLHASTHDFFGRDTQRAVRTFQAVHNLQADGIIGKNTAEKLLEDYLRHNDPNSGQQEIIDYLKAADYPNIHPKVIAAININLQDETPIRIELVKEDLKWIMPHGLYVFGYNLYTSKLIPQPITESGLEKVAYYHPGYYTDGRLDFQIDYMNYCHENNIYLSGADCSGKLVGLYRKLGVFPLTWDSKAHWLYHSYCRPIKESEMRPGDLLFKRISSGRIVHTAMYLGAGYVAEAVGTAYGIQITDNYDHVVKNYQKNKLERHKRFNVFGRPTFIA